MNKDEKNKDLENIVNGALAEWVLRKMYNTDQSVLVAKRVIEAGYRKVGDDEIIIKKSELARLKNLEINYEQVYEEYRKLEQERLHDEFKKHEQELARAILQRFYNYLRHPLFNKKLALSFVKDLAKELGIELED